MAGCGREIRMISAGAAAIAVAINRGSAPPARAARLAGRICSDAVKLQAAEPSGLQATRSETDVPDPGRAMD